MPSEIDDYRRRVRDFVAEHVAPPEAREAIYGEETPIGSDSIEPVPLAHDTVNGDDVERLQKLLRAYNPCVTIPTLEEQDAYELVTRAAARLTMPTRVGYAMR